ncbi:MAG: AmmeMemoRadiSam system radical SAM enzyme, partial [Planctomycetes bacterium]|nr:AmmeMemoRadiSam system radical SAM enzyme [Planctomycetota bacterium]
MTVALPVLPASDAGDTELYPGRWWHRDGQRIVCDLCPRRCELKAGDRGFCFVRQNVDDEMVLTTFGKSTGFCIDPIEKKPLNHFYPGTSVLSFGTAGCNLGCKFCQNWDISKSREIERLSERAFPEDIARACHSLGCKSVAFTYNDPVIWAEYAIETAKACRAAGIKTVAVTAGYITEEARGEFYEHMDAANVDLKAFTEEFYYKITLSHLQPVLDTLKWLKAETDVWFEITNLVIPQANDNDDEFRRMCEWVLDNVGDRVPVHFTAFHPDFRMRDREHTPPETLNRAREIALGMGLKHVYTGNVDDASRQSTYCPGCGKVLIERNWYELGAYALDGDRCSHCGEQIQGRFEERPGTWGRRRQPVDMRRFASAHAQIAQSAAGSPRARTRGLEVQSSTREPEMANDAAVAFELDERQRELLTDTAGELVRAATLDRKPNLPDAALGGLAERTVAGTFVTVKRQGHLRSCCGTFGTAMPLLESLRQSARRTATDDPRFPPLSATELPHLDLDVWVLFQPEVVAERGEDRIDAVTVGRHGLQIVSDGRRGLLLPGVPVDHGWDAEEFLNQVCIKAGLAPTAWKDDSTTLYRFAGEAYHGRIAEDGAEARPLY